MPSREAVQSVCGQVASRRSIMSIGTREAQACHCLLSGNRFLTSDDQKRIDHDISTVLLLIMLLSFLCVCCEQLWTLEGPPRVCDRRS